MRNHPWYSVLALLSLLLVVMLVAPPFAAKRDTVLSVARSLFGADKHQIGLADCSVQALKARYNLPVVERACDYVATLGTNTAVYRDIARGAAEADRECGRVEAVLDLAVRQPLGGDELRALVRSACRLGTPAQEQAWQERFDALAATATYPDVETALAAGRED